MPEDRRIRRSRKLLRDAFMELVLERGYASVTVEDIARRADVGRATFYAHYTDKESLFRAIVNELQDDLEARLRPLVPASSVGFTGAPVREVFTHASEHRDIYRIILRGEGDGIGLREFIKRRVAASAHVFRTRAEYHNVAPRIDVDVLARAWVGEQVAILQWFLETDPPPLTVDETATMLLDLSLRGRFWANGFTPSQLDAPIRAGDAH